jgi:hypothetical protein
MVSSITFPVLLCLIATTNNVIIYPNLISAANYTVIGGSSVSNAGFTTINGNLATSSIGALTGFTPPSVINGVTESNPNATLQALKDVTTAFNYLMGLPLTSLMTGIDLANQTLQWGVYKFDSSAGINVAAGILTLNGTGLYIFQIGSTLITTANSEIRTINGAKASCIFWVVGSSATIGQSSRFVGNILASASVGLGTGVIYNGSIYAQASVTLNANTVTGQPNCDLRQTIPDSNQGRVNRNLPQNILLYILILVLVSLFRQ